MRERRHRVFLLAGDVQGLAAGDEDVEVRARAEQFGDVGRRCDDLLEVVQQHEHRLVADVLGEAVRRAERLRRGRQHELRMAQRRERHPPDTVGIGLRRDCRRLRRQPRLTRAACASERQ